jgi:predicted SAM-dependent methyltransferase
MDYFPAVEGRLMLEDIKAILRESPFDGVARPLYRSLLMFPRTALGGDKRIIRRYLAQHEVKKLQLGCGPNIFEGWLNSDYFPRLSSAICLDTTSTYPFEDETFDYIFSEHMIEHVSYEKGQLMLRECLRVLKDGGKIRISTPDLAFLIALYQTDKSDLREFIRWSTEEFVEGAPFCEDTFVINHFFRGWGHMFLYDEKVLHFCLKNAGFERITKCALNQSEDEVLRNLENGSRSERPETLILEATKRVDKTPIHSAAVSSDRSAAHGPTVTSRFMRSERRICQRMGSVPEGSL